MIAQLEEAILLWRGESAWSQREFFIRLSTAIAAVSSYQHELTLWRGHGSTGWRLSPRLMRELPAWAVAQDVVNRETSVLLEEARRARPGWLEGMTLKESTDLDLLALLQHLGALTPLLDLTSDPYVALYFAVAGEPEDGLLLGLQAKSWTNITARPSIYAQSWETQIRRLSDETGNLSYFRPPNISARIPAQRSVLALGVVASQGSWASAIGTLGIEDLGDWSKQRANLAFGRRKSKGRPSLPPVLGFHIPHRRKQFIRDLLATNFGISATTLFPDPQGFGEWRLRQERSWNRDVSATGAQEMDVIVGLTARQKLAAFRAVWGKGWVTDDQYAAQHGLSNWQARTDISALIESNVIIRREDGQLIEGPVIRDLRRKLGREV
jgi:hypothetical protein